MTDRSERVVLALGSNLGDRTATLAGAVHDLADLAGLTLVAVSPVYESTAVKLDGADENAPQYLNAVLTIDYSGDPYDLLDAVNAIEAGHGRVRAERWGDRTLDIDLIVFGQRSIDDDRLTLPHPRAAERDFVLAPWLDLDPAAAIPGRGLVRDLLAATGNAVRRAADTAFGAPTLEPRQ
ncbi:2-amino-4-hydroxy-6-hydroxymethyldihydropteridine diphosphokinase [Cryobacterium sp. Y82]|uniref:2-amino-4-hydroxy-6- hydroxymethyldihydropteridine diphosphokinase n=1 Tax=Cryobacterium sp. Y82 TaxID=2045017 RepID=UPI000CE368E4|nr:2-amino-4-hydroxy-6-hydroxymethyldihydropteridine diphosphokinase [Cryobacterium sp. Y82]